MRFSSYNSTKIIYPNRRNAETDIRIGMSSTKPDNVNDVSLLFFEKAIFHKNDIYDNM